LEAEAVEAAVIGVKAEEEAEAVDEIAASTCLFQTQLPELVK